MKTSSKKSTPAPPKPTKSKAVADDDYEYHGFDGLPDGASSPAEIKAYEQIAELQRDLADANDKRLEERFWLGGLSSIFCLVLISSSIPAPLWAIILPLYVGVLALAAKKCGVDDVVVLLSDIYALVTRKKGADD